MKKLFLILILLLQTHTIFSQSEDSSSKKIIGTWYNKANQSIKWVFSQDGKVYNYNKDVFKVMYKYTISHSCGNNSDDTIEYLTLMDKDGNEFCFKINGINENKNGILDMTNMSNMVALLFVNKIQ
ncbi:MAG: hypothetical protein ABI850_03705 [Flavobacterium sp.]